MPDSLDLRACCPSPWRLTRWECLALAVWAAVLLFISYRTLVAPNQRTVYPVWSSTSRLWWSGGELYKPYRPASVREGFRYSPTFPILTTPFALFPDAVGGVVWRWFCVAAFAAAVVWWVKSVVPANPTRNQIAALFLLLLPLSIQSVSNGQSQRVRDSLDAGGCRCRPDGPLELG